MSKYFSYDQECGFEWHETEEEAIQAAQDYIDDYRSNAGDGWSEAVESVCWGLIKQVAQAYGMSADDSPDSDKEYADYALEDLD